MKHLFRFLLFGLLCSCKTENSEEFSLKKEVHEYNLKSSFQSNDPIDKPYKKSSVNDIYGKREYIDSLNYTIIRVYFKNDTNQIQLETIDDLMSDTTLHTWYYENGQMKNQSRFSYFHRVPFGSSITYDVHGNLEEKIDHEKGYSVKLRHAIEISLKKGLSQPFEVGLSADSLYWDVLIWKTSSFDTITNEGVSTGRGLSIHRNTGNIKEVEKKRDWVI